MVTYGTDPVTRHEPESRSSNEDGDQQEENGRNSSNGAEDSQESGTMRKHCATTYEPSSIKNVSALQRQGESLEWTLMTIPRLVFLMEKFRARIENMEATKGPAERNPTTYRNRAGETPGHNVDIQMENRSTSTRRTPMHARAIDDHQSTADEGGDHSDVITIRSPRGVGNVQIDETTCRTNPDSYYTNHRSRRRR